MVEVEAVRERLSCHGCGVRNYMGSPLDKHDGQTQPEPLDTIYVSKEDSNLRIAIVLCMACRAELARAANPKRHGEEVR